MGGEGYYAELLQFAGELDEVDRAVVQRLLRIHSARVEQWARQAAADQTVDVAKLVDIWHSLWRTLESGLTPESWTRVSRLAEG
jgi:hypothetical protein